MAAAAVAAGPRGSGEQEEPEEEGRPSHCGAEGGTEGANRSTLGEVMCVGGCVWVSGPIAPGPGGAMGRL